MKMKRLAYAIASLGVAAASTAYANDAIQTEQLEKITVTGSNIKRINREGPTAVEVIKKADIERSGASTVAQLLDKIPSVTSTTYGTSSSSFASGAANVGLRGMNTKYVLILLNGRRVANYGFAEGGENSFVDLNSLPLSAIESVEILRDGASAIYGSDAVAGVINFKTKKNFKGIEGSARYGQTIDGDGQETSLNLTAGWGDLNEEGRNFLLSIDTYHREPVFSRNHEQTKTSDMRRYGGVDGRDAYSWGAWKDISANGDTHFHPIPGCDPSKIITTAKGNSYCLNDPAATYKQEVPRTTRFGALGVYTQKLGTGEIFGELGFNRVVTKMDSDYAFIDEGSLGYVTPGMAAYPNPAQLAGVGGYQPGDDLFIRKSITEPGRRYRTTTSDTYRALAGYRTTLGNWDLETALSINENKIRDETSNALLGDALADNMQNGVNGGPGYNPFISNNPMSVIRPFLHTILNTSTSKLQTADLKMSNSELFSLPAGNVGFAWGVQANHETINSTPDEQTVSGNIIGYGASPVKGSRVVTSAYGEFSIPVIKDLEVQLALRGDHYNDFGDSVNPKIAFSYKPVKEVLIRGGATTSFKAPTLPEMNATTAGYSEVHDYKQCLQTGVSAQSCTDSKYSVSGGNPNLKPEKAQNYSLGFVLQPIKELSASIDYYYIKQTNTIQSLDPQYVVDNEGAVGTVKRRKPTPDQVAAGVTLGDIVEIDAPYINVGKTRTSGLDIDLQYEVSLGGWGTLKFREVQNRIFSFKESKLANDPMLESVDTASTPRWKNVFSATYDFRKAAVTLTARTYAGTKNIGYSSSVSNSKLAERIPSFSILDMNVDFQPIKNLNVSAGINNVGNKKVPYGNGTDVTSFVGPAADTWGRSAYINVRYKFK